MSKTFETRKPVAPTDSRSQPRRAAVLGKPVAHSLSPVLHMAAYQALGLTQWTYERVEVGAGELPSFVDGLGTEWAGLSVTMPGKRAALTYASETTDRARAVGAANTLVPLADGTWLADNTDVDGVIGALRTAGGYQSGAGEKALVLGAGGTASAAVVALAELGISQIELVVRDPARAVDTSAAARRAKVDVSIVPWGEADFAALTSNTSVLVSTVPPEAVTPHVDALAFAPCVLDVIYHPWPTPLATAIHGRDGRLATGLDMLLHQAFRQVEHFTGQAAPRAAMRAALRTATGEILPLPAE